MSITVYGIKACDTMKKAFTWLDANEVAWQFHDYKKLGIDADSLRRWISALGWETVINRRGTSWRKLPEASRLNMDAESAILAAMDNPSLIKRPIIEGKGILTAGFDSEHWRILL